MEANSRKGCFTVKINDQIDYEISYAPEPVKIPEDQMKLYIMLEETSNVIKLMPEETVKDNKKSKKNKSEQKESKNGSRFFNFIGNLTTKKSTKKASAQGEGVSGDDHVESGKKIIISGNDDGFKQNSQNVSKRLAKMYNNKDFFNNIKGDM